MVQYQVCLCLINKTWRKEEAKIVGDISYGKTMKKNAKAQLKNKELVLPLNLALKFVFEDNVKY